MTPSAALRAFTWLARHVEKPMLERAALPGIQRLRMEVTCRLFLRHRRPFAYRSEPLGGIPARVLEGRGEGTLFYIHGGAFAICSPRTHQGLAARLAEPLGLTAILPDYRLAPEHPFPSGLDDLERAWRNLPEGPVLLAGDSAGGGLAFSLLHRILAKGLPRPAAVIAFSPWCDLTLTGASLHENAATDPLLPASRISEVAALYLQGADPAQPDASPIHGTFPGAPPALIQVTAGEILLSDAERMEAALRASGAQATREVLPHGLHAFQLMTGWIPEADAAVASAVAFARTHLPGGHRHAASGGDI